VVKNLIVELPLQACHKNGMKNNPKNSSEIHLFDRKIVRQHRDSAAHFDWQKHGFLFEEVSDRLAERLLDVNRRFPTSLDLGCHSGAFGSILKRQQKVDTLISSDLSGSLMGLGAEGFRVLADEEFLPFAPSSFDLIGSVLSLHWTNDLPGSLVQIARCLKPDGLFLGAIFGVDSLQELKWALVQAESEIKGGVSPRISPFAEIRDAGALLQRAGFALPVTDVDTITLKYSSPFDVMKELRGMGEGNALVNRQKTLTGRAVLMRAAELYAEHFSDEDGLVSASFQVIYMTGWAPHESQQKPARRGSGQKSLGDIL